MSDATIEKWHKLDGKRFPKLLKEIEQRRYEEGLRRELRLEQARRGEIPSWRVD